MTNDQCPIIKDWEAMKASIYTALADVKETRSAVESTKAVVTDILDHVKHLAQLDSMSQALASVATMAKALIWVIGGSVLLFGVLLMLYVIHETAASVAATGPAGTSITVQGGKK